MEAIIKTIKKNKWKSIWAGKWSLLTCSDYGEHYLSTLKVGGKPFLKSVIFIYQDGKSSAWVKEKDIDDFSNRVAKLIRHDKGLVKKIADDLKKSTEIALDFMSKNKKDITLPIFQKYQQIIHNYYVAHVQVKYLVDALTEKELKLFLPALEKARVVAEPVFAETIVFDNAVAKMISRENKIPIKEVLSLTKEEFYKLWQKKSFFPKDLDRRYKFSALLFLNKKSKVYTGERAKKIQEAMTPLESVDIIEGQCAFPGKVTGHVKIIIDPEEDNKIEKGDILVSNMTRPEFLLLIKKAAGFITNAGGILSHAAITARELKKPCIIGTKIATQILKDGDLIEVDANKGIVKIIK